MAVIKKTLFPKNLDRYSVLVTDTDPNSRYFKITELPDTFTGGKNAFLIAGSEELLGDTKIQIELKDGAGNIIYHEPGEGMISSSFNGETFVTEYFEGVSKVVSVYIYPDTSYGPCTLTILGELSKYEDGNGIINPIPIEWEGQYNVKWQKTINVNPSLANTTKIRFYQRPTATIKEILSPIYRIEGGEKVNSGVSQSFADIKLSKLETFAGDVKRIKVFRTSEGDISDYDLIQDILVESKELLTSYGLTGSVVGQTGIITSETLKSFWNTGSLNAYLTSSRVESGVALNGSGYFTYTSSLDIKSTNTYELNLDAFYSSSTPSNLGIYLVSGSMSSSIGTLSGISPTKNLLDTVVPFKIPTDFPSASLYFSQSQGEWHLGNISLKLSQDTAFSPDEISFVTTMPSVIGNETFNFKFEFYDVNNNYVPVAVTQSLTFTGGVNINNTLLLVSASASQSLAVLATVSSSISGTMTVYSSSASSSVNVLSGSVSGTIGRVSGSISGSIYSLSGSVSSSLTLTSGSITLVSSSLVFTSQSLSSSLTTLSSSLSSSFSNAASQSAYQVYSASQYLDKFIFTDANGKLNQPPTASDPGLYLGSEYLGYYNGTGTSGWKTYMDNQGDFYLTSSTVGGGFLAWDSSTATLQIQGAINIQGGNAATTTALSSSLNAVSGAINSATASVSNSLAANIFTNANGLVNRPPVTLVGVPSGLYLGPEFLGYYNGSNWKTYMQNNGNFFLSGVGSDSLSWNGSNLTINGSITVTGGNAATSAALTSSLSSTLSSANSTALGHAANAVSSGSISAAAAQTAAQLFATSAAGRAVDSGSAAATAAQSAAITQAKSDASASVNLLANGNWTAGTGTFITANSISSPVIAGNAGYISGIFVVGNGGAITLNGTDKKMYIGTGTYNNVNTAFFVDNAGRMSLKDKLTWDGTTLSVKGVIQVSDGTEVTTATVTGAASGSTALQSGQTGKSLGLTGGSVGGVTIASTKIYVGTGTWGNANTGFYVDNTGQMSLKDKLTWDGTTLSVKGVIQVSDGTEVTAATVSGAASGSTALQSGQTGKSLGLTGGSVGGVTIASTKIYVGTGTHGNANTGFYVDSDGKMSLKDKLVWDGTTLSITGTVVITGGATKTAIDDAAAIAGAASSVANSATASAAAAQNTADGKVAPSQVTSHLGGENVTTIDGGKISALSFSGKTAIFDQGSVGGWTMDGTGLYKTTGAYTLRLGANAQRISISQANAVDSIDRVRVDSSLDIPTITVSSTGSLRWDAAGQNLLTIYDTSYPTFSQINTNFDTPDYSPTHPAVSGVYGIIGLIYAAEEIFVESESFPNIDSTIDGYAAFEVNSEVEGYYSATLRVRKFPTDTDAFNETNADVEYGDKQAIVAYKQFRHNAMDSDRNINKSQVFGATFPADGPGGINTPAPGSPGNWYRVELRQIWDIQVYSPTPYGDAYIVANRPADNIFVKFGRVSNGYSVFSPGGLQVYQGVRNYMNASLPSGSTGDGANFFIVKGKSQIIGSLDVTSGFSASNKQFKIQHPLNENKWLYHTSTESPRADLIYRGMLQLQSGVGSASIDSASNMTNGTFNALTKNPQLFLQNNESFDRIKGYVQSGSVYVLSENQNSTASIDWSVIAERQDTEILKSPLYDRNGKYKTENYKGEYLEAMRSKRFLNYSGSI